MSFPSGAGIVSTLTPPTRSGAPFSSVLRCACSDATTAPQRGSVAMSATTFAPVPVSTGYAVASGPNRARTASCRRAVHGSSPYEISCPALAAASAARTSGWAGE
ncbi:Uncharacterised protein [Mycobacteroides abscessus]|nr:Uncharacterised protein [Mycobacteroides abscessus]